MSEEAIKALMEAPDISVRIEHRDQFLMVLLYDTGARIQELLDLCICDLRLGNTPTVALHGKGNKIRIVPLMKETVVHVRNYLRAFHPGILEQSPGLQKYVSRAKEKCADVPDNVHPHLWRHSRAMHLYQHGNSRFLEKIRDNHAFGITGFIPNSG